MQPLAALSGTMALGPEFGEQFDFGCIPHGLLPFVAPMISSSTQITLEARCLSLGLALP
jgi:hypothetical protein